MFRSCGRLGVATSLTLGVAASLLVGCSGSAEEAEAARLARMTLDDSAVAVGADGPQLKPSFDVTTVALRSSLPLATLKSAYTELQQMDSETLTPSEPSGCDTDKVKEPALPAVEVLATKAPAAGAHQPEIADIVAARGQDEFVVNEYFRAARKAGHGCASFSRKIRDLGEGSYDPGESGSTKVSNASVDGWDGLRLTTPVKVTGNSWTQQVARESLVLRRGQIVVHVRVEAPDQAAATQRVDSLMKQTLSTVGVTKPAVVTAGNSTPAPSAGTVGPTGQPTGQPSEQSSAQPSTQPTGQPSVNAANVPASGAVGDGATPAGN